MGVREPYKIYEMYNIYKRRCVQERRAKPCHLTLVVTLLRLEVLRVLRKLEYKLLGKDYLQINAFFVPVVVV